MKTLLFMVLVFPLSGCVLTKVVSVPMRAVGAVISVIPVAGNSIHDAIDSGAEVVDDIPV